MPEMHEAMEAEARERLAPFIPLEDQERLGVAIALGTGPADEEVVRYANEHGIDLAIVQARKEDEALDGPGPRRPRRRDRARCSSCVDR